MGESLNPDGCHARNHVKYVSCQDETIWKRFGNAFQDFEKCSSMLKRRYSVGAMDRIRSKQARTVEVKSRLLTWEMERHTQWKRKNWRLGFPASGNRNRTPPSLCEHHSSPCRKHRVEIFSNAKFHSWTEAKGPNFPGHRLSRVSHRRSVVPSYCHQRDTHCVWEMWENQGKVWKRTLSS